MRHELLEAVQWLADQGELEKLATAHAKAVASVPPSRAEIAMRAMTGVLANPFYDGISTQEIAECSVRCADALLAALAKEPE